MRSAFLALPRAVRSCHGSHFEAWLRAEDARGGREIRGWTRRAAAGLGKKQHGEETTKRVKQNAFHLACVLN